MLPAHQFRNMRPEALYEKGNFLKSKFLINTGWIMFCRIYQAIINLVVTMLTARYLGPGNFGLINYAASLCALMTVFCTLGTNDIMVNELVTRRDCCGRILGTTVFFRLCSTVLSIAVICLYVAAANPDEPLTLTVTALYSLSLLFQCFETIKYWYQANLMSRVPSVITCSAYTVVAIYKVILLVTGKSVVWFAVSTTLDYGVIAILLLVCYTKQYAKEQPLCVRPRQEYSLLRRSAPFIASGMMVALYGQMDKIMLKQFLGETEVGYYSAAATISMMWAFVLAAVIDSAKPMILGEYQTCKSDYEKHLSQLYGAVIYISVAAALIISLLSKPIIWVLYGESFLPARSALCIVSWYTGFSYLGVARSIYLVSQGKQKYEKWIAASGAVCNLILNSLMIPAWGINGAAAATLITQVFTNLIVGFLFNDIRRNNILILKGLNLSWLLGSITGRK